MENLKEKNNKAIFIGCIDHAINLCGQHSFAQNVTCVTFFGAVKKVEYCLYSTFFNFHKPLGSAPQSQQIIC